MRLIKWIPMLILLFCSACSSNVIEEAETVRLDYWESDETKEKPEEEYLDENSGLNIFMSAVNTAEELTKQNVIITRPLLSLEFMMEAEENRNYHLWVTDKREGYLQSLHPQKSRTYRMDPDSVEELIGFFKTKESVKVLQGEIEFEQ